MKTRQYVTAETLTSQVGPWRTYVTAETLIVRVNMVLFFIY